MSNDQDSKKGEEIKTKGENAKPEVRDLEPFLLQAVQSVCSLFIGVVCGSIKNPRK